MEMIYRKEFQLSDLHVDCFLRLKPSVLLYFAQEVAADHAAEQARVNLAEYLEKGIVK